MYSRDEVADLALGQLLPDALDRAHRAFCGFATEFGRTWIEEYYGSYPCPADVVYIAALWDAWCTIKTLQGHDGVRARWKAGLDTQGVVPEVLIISHIVRQGFSVKLFPKVGSRVCDFKFNADRDWIYCEVSQRGVTPVLNRARTIMRELSIAASRAVVGLHGKIAVSRDITEEELIYLLRKLQSSPAPIYQRIAGFAHFRADPLETAMGQHSDIIEKVPEPRCFMTYVGHGLKGSVCISVSDRAAEEMVRSEAKQLPADHPGILLLDLSRMISPIPGWKRLIERRLESGVHTRVSAVVVLRTSLTDVGLQTVGEVIVNTRAKRPLSDETLKAILSLVQE